MNHKIENWFPKPIYYADNVCIDQLPTIEEVIRKIIKDSGTIKTDYLGVESTHETENNLHEHPELKILVNNIFDHILQFSQHLGYDPIDIFSMKMQMMWANISDQHGYNFTHTHAGSIFSGAYYIKTVPENTITFFNNHETLLPAKHKNTIYSMNVVNYECIPGRLILFKSDFPHGNVPQKQPGEKIVISFNVGY